MHELGRGILLPDRLIDMKRLEVPLASLDINWLPGTFRDFLSILAFSFCVKISTKIERILRRVHSRRTELI